MRKIIIYKYLVVIYASLNVKAVKSVYILCTKIFYSIKNYVHHAKNHPYQEV